MQTHDLFIYCLLICSNNLLNWWPLIEMKCTCLLPSFSIWTHEIWFESLNMNDFFMPYFNTNLWEKHPNPIQHTIKYLTCLVRMNGEQVINCQMFENRIKVIISVCYCWIFLLLFFVLYITIDWTCKLWINRTSKKSF